MIAGLDESREIVSVGPPCFPSEPSFAPFPTMSETSGANPQPDRFPIRLWPADVGEPAHAGPVGALFVARIVASSDSEFVSR